MKQMESGWPWWFGSYIEPNGNFRNQVGQY